MVLAFIVNVAAYYMLASMAKESRRPGGELEDAGTDINDSWIAEYVGLLPLESSSCLK